MIRKFLLLHLLLIAPLFAQTNTFIPGGSVNSQTNSYTATASDVGKIVKMNCSACMLTLPSPPPFPNWTIVAKNVNPSNLTISPNGIALDDSFSEAFVTQGQWLQITTDGNVYTSLASGGTGGGGGGTPTLSLTVNPSSIPFGTVQIGSVSDPQVVTITNNGNVPAIVNSAAFTTGTKFTTTNLAACNGLLDAGGGSCSLLISYAPTTSTSDTDTLTFTSNAPVDPQNPLTVSLSGTGQSGATFPITLTGFGAGGCNITDTANANSLNANFNVGQASGISTFNYATGTSVTLTATASAGSVFSAFGGTGITTTSPSSFNVTMAQTISVTCNPAPVPVTVTLVASGQGTGTTVSNVNDVNTGNPVSCTQNAGVQTSSPCQIAVNPGTAIIFTGTPGTTGVGSCIGNPCTGPTWVGATNCSNASTCPVTPNSNQQISVGYAAPATGAPFNRVQTIPGGTAGTNKITGNWAAAQNAGDALIVYGMWSDATTTVSGSVTDTAGNTYTQSACSPKAGSGLTTVLYYAPNIAAAAAGANTTTMNLTASPAYRAIFAIEVSGLTATPADACAGATGAGGPVASGAMTPGTANDYLTADSAIGGGVSAVSPGFSQQFKNAGNDLEDLVGATTGAYNFQPTQTGVGFTTILESWKTTTAATNTVTVNFICAPGSTGSGTVTGSGVNLSCASGSGVANQVTVGPGSTLTFNAQPLSGSVFGTYSGGNCGISPQCTAAALTTNTTISVAFTTSGTLNTFVNGSTGNNNNSGLCAVAGTPAGCTGPFQTIQGAINTVAIGASGTTITVAHSGAPYAGFSVSRGGASATRRMVIKCDAQWTVGSSTGCKLNAQINVTTANNVDIGAIGNFGFEIGNLPNSDVAIDVIWQCGSSTSCTSGNSVHIIGNYLHDIGQNVNEGAGVGCPFSGIILIQSEPGLTGFLSDTQIIGNTIDHFGVFPNASCASAQGIYMTGPGVAYNNIVTRAPAAGIQAYGKTCNTNISNNVLVNNGDGLILYGHEGCAPGFNTIDNNVIANNVKQAFVNGGNFGGSVRDCSTSPLRQALMSNNIIFGNANNSIPTSSCQTVQNQKSENPTSTFINYTGDATGNYRLKSTSIAINGGTPQCTAGGSSPCVPNYDILNVARPQRANFDIGAYELP